MKFSDAFLCNNTAFASLLKATTPPKHQAQRKLFQQKMLDSLCLCGFVAKKLITYFEVMKQLIFILLVAMILCQISFAQIIHSPQINLKWNKQTIVTETPGGLSQQYLMFDGAKMVGEYLRMMPQYFFEVEVIGNYNYSAQIINAQTESQQNIYPKDAVDKDFKISVSVGESRGKYFLIAAIIPLRKNSSGQLEKLTQFNVEFTPTTINKFYSQNNSKKKVANHSVLSSGRWFQLSTNADGVYKIDAALLQSMGIDLSSFDPQNLRLFSMGNGNIPESNSITRPDDLEEMSIVVNGESDHHFDVGDNILFYGQQPDKVFYNSTSKTFSQQKNLYSSKTYYYLTFDLGAGKRISNQSSSGSANTTVTSFDDFQYIDNDGINLAHTGREWFDANDFSSANSRSYNFNFPNIITSENVQCNILAAAQSTAATSMDVYFNGGIVNSISFGGYTPGYDQPIATVGNYQASLSSNTANISLQLNYHPYQNSSANAWIDYITLQARRSLAINGNQMQFRDSRSIGAGKISNFLVSNFSNQTIWDITDPLQPLAQQGTQSGSQFSFTIPTDTLHQFIAFNGGYLTPTFESTVPNQDIHGQLVNAPQFIIVANPAFINAANTLANFHQNYFNQKTLVLPANQVYHEFGGGKPDASAIRDMAKAFYDAAGTDTTKMPKYLLLLGDGSYDNRNIIGGNTAYIPTYESSSSIDQASSFTSDDFFGLLSSNEGSSIESGGQLLDMAVGRIPAQTTADANAVVNKIINYKSANAYGNWRNLMTFVADIGDQNLHENQADAYTTTIATTHPEMNIDKIYLDAYKEDATASGGRFPAAHDAIIRRLESGTLVLNYTGHGSTIGWSHTRVFETPDIMELDNLNKLPLFITATCEFSMYDQPNIVTAGEHLLLNPTGGAIALMTTARLVYTGGNEEMNGNIYNYFFNKNSSGNHLTIGEIFQLGKNATTQDDNNRKFTLLGDPALTLNFPDQKIKNLQINNHAINNDTIKAFGKYTITGMVTDLNGNLLPNFNGVAYPTIYDKPVTELTLGNDANTSVRIFSLQQNAIFKGKATVKNGLFHYTFICPKDISYTVGKGKISYYASTNSDDAMGYDGSLNVGTIADSTIRDHQGPVIKLFMNDTKFANGGTTDANPTLLVNLQDASGINVAGNGIGHDVTATLDNNDKDKQTLNDYYESDLDNFQKGSIAYPLKGLTNGLHTLRVKAWDVFDNSNETEIQFNVTSQKQLALTHVLNYPNPFTTHTNFFFEYNMPGQLMEVHISIYTISGKLIKTIRQQIETAGYISEGIEWDGRDDFGDKIGRGVYIYKLSIKNSSGLSQSVMQKLVIL